MVRVDGQGVRGMEGTRARTMQLPLLPLTLTGAKAEMPKLSPEEARRRVEQRQKHLNIVKDRPSYRAYVDRVPPEQRDPRTPDENPLTPDPKKRDMSRRRWQDLVNKWSWLLKELHFQHGGPDPATPDPEPDPDPEPAPAPKKKDWADYDEDEPLPAFPTQTPPGHRTRLCVECSSQIAS